MGAAAGALKFEKVAAMFEFTLVCDRVCLALCCEAWFTVDEMFTLTGASSPEEDEGEACCCCCCCCG